MDPRIADYIRANRRTYTREAITKQLIEAGHDPGEIERTWAALDARDADAVAGEGFWGRFALILIGINLGVFLVVGLLTGTLLQIGGGGGAVILVVFGVALAIGALIAWGIVAATGPTKMSPATALVVGVSIPLLFALLIGGACYALIGAVGPVGPPSRPAVIEADLGPPLDLSGTAQEAGCQTFGSDPAEGVSVFGYFESPGGVLDISLTVTPDDPGGRPPATIWVSSLEPDDTGRTLAWGNEGPDAGEIEVAMTGFDGTVTFTELPAMQGDPGGDLGDPLSGEISWTCE